MYLHTQTRTHRHYYLLTGWQHSDTLMGFQSKYFTTYITHNPTGLILCFTCNLPPFRPQVLHIEADSHLTILDVDSMIGFMIIIRVFFAWEHHFYVSAFEMHLISIVVPNVQKCRWIYYMQYTVCLKNCKSPPMNDTTPSYLWSHWFLWDVYFHGKGHSAIFYDGHALSSIMDMPAGNDILSHP